MEPNYAANNLCRPLFLVRLDSFESKLFESVQRIFEICCNSIFEYDE